MSFKIASEFVIMNVLVQLYQECLSFSLGGMLHEVSFLLKTFQKLTQSWHSLYTVDP